MQIDPHIPLSVPWETLGTPQDVSFLWDESWTKDTEVCYTIVPRKGRWHVDILFFHVKDPFILLIRPIDHYPSFRRAETFAKIFQRGIRKDVRGTQKRNTHGYDFCDN